MLEARRDSSKMVAAVERKTRRIKKPTKVVEKVAAPMTELLRSRRGSWRDKKKKRTRKRRMKDQKRRRSSRTPMTHVLTSSVTSN
jgi:hypothetical protein